MHMNMGDHLIMHGTLEFFKLNNIHIDQFSSIHDYNLNKINTADVLIFAGGGNFGDLYAQTHKIRNQIILKAISQGKKNCYFAAIATLPEPQYTKARYSELQQQRKRIFIYQGSAIL